jgi:hypothetical protein
MIAEMTMSLSSGAVLVGLGAFHGVNPGMGWLFAVALGMQERSRSAVWRALLPLAMGHALAIAAAVAIAVLVGAIIPLHNLRWPVAALLLALGVSRLIRHRHPRWVGMRVGIGGLTVWSFLMASAHGAGLMVVPVFLAMGHASNQPPCHTISAPTPIAALLATSLHAVGYLLITAVVALVVFEKLGVGMLRKAWFNVDLVWVATLIATGLMTVLL